MDTFKDDRIAELEAENAALRSYVLGQYQVPEDDTVEYVTGGDLP